MKNTKQRSPSGFRLWPRNQTLLVGIHVCIYTACCKTLGKRDTCVPRFLSYECDTCFLSHIIYSHACTTRGDLVLVPNWRFATSFVHNDGTSSSAWYTFPGNPSNDLESIYCYFNNLFFLWPLEFGVTNKNTVTYDVSNKGDN